MRLQEPRQLRRPFGVGAGGDADEDGAIDDEDVAAIEGRGLLQADDLAVTGDHRNDRVDFFSAGGRAGPRDHRKLRHDHRHVLDEVRIG